jgi:hypothetical protein
MTATVTGIAARVPHMILNVATRSCDFCRNYVLNCSCPRNVNCEHCELDVDDAGEHCEWSEDGKHQWMGDVGDGREAVQEIAA